MRATQKSEPSGKGSPKQKSRGLCFRGLLLEMLNYTKRSEFGSYRVLNFELL